MDAQKAINSLGSYSFINGLVNPSHKKISQVFSKSSMEIKTALLTKVIANVTSDSTDDEILNSASNLIKDILFKEAIFSGHCKISPVILCLFSDKFKDVSRYDCLRAKYQVVGNIRTLDGLYNQFNLFALKSMEPVLTFINSLFNAEMVVKDSNDESRFDVFFEMMGFYMEYLFTQYKDCNNLKYISYQRCLEGVMEIALNNYN